MILTITPNPAVDQTVSLDEPLSAGGVNRATDRRFDAGGKGVNVSGYLRKLGVETVATGFVGGFLGDYLVDELDTANVPSEFVRIDGITRLNTTVLAEDGEYKMNQRGPPLGEAAVEDLVATVRDRDPETVLVAGSLPPGLDADAVDRLATAGDWATAIDAGGGLLGTLEANYDLCKPNREELAAATGLPTATVEECAVAAAELRERGFERVVASLGADGAILVSGEGAYYAPALQVEAIDTVGAGDSLLAGVLAAFDAGESERRALARGVAAAARVVSTEGTEPPPFRDLHVDGIEISPISTGK
ncbi:1-phosphofructokinase [Halomicrococcus sp. NG-SE-24]|uniref:1-phosphofructokinase n=1 Tax=Halomicrococcus sp. NG-SE-24 TaxID=3436928 RepID=UPI003D9991F2